MKCNIPSNLVGACDLEWGHDGAMHSNAGDGFYAKDYAGEHLERQMIRSSRTSEVMTPEQFDVAQHMQAANRRGHV